jgi:membrane protease subunit (stomatin/prohibitin family)
MGRWFGAEMRIFGLTDFVAPLLVRGASRPFEAILKNPRFTFNWPKEAGVYIINCKRIAGCRRQNGNSED